MVAAMHLFMASNIHVLLVDLRCGASIGIKGGLKVLQACPHDFHGHLLISMIESFDMLC